jgi:ABC-type transport system involved in cytochrome bd biosynthesis fused ATPase/permease subunit
VLNEQPLKALAAVSLSLADFAAYVEVGQLQGEFTNVFNFAAFPNVQRWLALMKQVAGHDNVHTVLRELGDISVEPPALALRSLGLLRCAKLNLIASGHRAGFNYP